MQKINTQLSFNFSPNLKTWLQKPNQAVEILVPTK